LAIESCLTWNHNKDLDKTMITSSSNSSPELMNAEEIHAFGVEIVHNQLVEAGWAIETADVYADLQEFPQITAIKDGELGFFVVRTDIYPKRGRIEGEGTFQTLVKYANDRGGSCYFASVSIANSEGKTEDEMAVPVKGVAYNVAFDGLVKMELPDVSA
jgi:hypothetical protein